MEKRLIERIGAYVEAHKFEAESLLKELGKIPAPSHQEGKRAAFVKEWLLAQGAEKVFIDDVQNVICEIGTEEHKDIVAFLAHTDIVFPDTDEIHMVEDGRILRAPGIGDDTANLVNLLMGAKYLIQEKPAVKHGIVIVANSCEEGLGNLDGCKAFMRQYADRIYRFYSFDGYMGQCTSSAVGSHRYQITVKTKGGHSYLNFGNENAIQILAELIHKLYQIQIPDGPKTTYNVGRIEGGTTVNTIAQEAFVLYEFRSTSQKNLEYMQEKLQETVETMKGDYEITVEILGIRPGNGDLDEKALAEFTAASADVIQTYYDGPMEFGPFSTDANVPLSMGILANTIGTIMGDKAHTRQEWVDLDTLPTGGKIVLNLMLNYAEY